MSEWGRRRGPSPKVLALAAALVVAFIVIVVLKATASDDQGQQLTSLFGVGASVADVVFMSEVDRV